MTGFAMFVVLDKTEHILGGDEHTLCGLVVPTNGTFTKVAAGKVCSNCQTVEARAAKQAGDGDEPQV